MTHLLKQITFETDTGSHSFLDPLAFKPNLAGFGATEGSDDEDEDDSGAKAGTSGIYRPPRLVPLPFNEDTKGKALAS